MLINGITIITKGRKSASYKINLAICLMEGYKSKNLSDASIHAICISIYIHALL